MATPLRLTTGQVYVVGPIPLAAGGLGAALTDPNADRILFWDDSAGAVTWLTAGTGLTITDTTLSSSSAITGTNTHVLFFDGANTPAGDAGLTYNKTTDTLTTSVLQIANTQILNHEITGDTGASTQFLYTYGGTSANRGGTIIQYGPTHAINPGVILFNTGTSGFGTEKWRITEPGHFLAAGAFNITTTGTVDCLGVKLSGGTSITTIAAGVAAGYKVARGSTALDGSNPTTVATGLATVVSFTASLRRTTALTAGTAFVTSGTPSGANVDVYGWVLAGTASTGTEVFDWVAVGT